MFTLASSSGTSTIGMIAIYAVIILGFYLIFMRPQRKEQKRLKEMIDALEVGDTVLTSSGFYGIVIDMTDEDVVVEFGNNKNCRIPMQKQAISQVEKPGGEE